MRLTLLLCFIFVFQFLNAQQLSPEVLSSSGDDFSSSSASLNWTLGELSVETYSDGSNILTQGFHQTRLIVSSYIPEVQLAYKLEVYPNPVCYRLTVKSEKDKIYFKLCDIKGKVFSEGNTNSKTYQIDLSTYPTGLYILEIDKIKSFKIIKQ